MSVPKHIPFRDIPAGCWPVFILALAAVLLVILLACAWSQPFCPA